MMAIPFSQSSGIPYNECGSAVLLHAEDSSSVPLQVPVATLKRLKELALGDTRTSSSQLNDVWSCFGPSLQFHSVMGLPE